MGGLFAFVMRIARWEEDAWTPTPRERGHAVRFPFPHSPMEGRS